jgi:outer membrane protein OmpA-like peptidoglycan-associated protein
MKIKTLFWLLSLYSLGLTAQEKVIVFFDFNKYDLNEAASSQLEDWVSKSKDIEVTKIYGFCDWKGTNSYNDTLSVRRVKTVFNFLKDKNIKVKEGYEIRGFGEDFEQSKVQSENRKVLIAYENKKAETPVIVLDADGSLPLQEKIKEAKVGDKIKLKNINFFNMTPRILPKSKTVLFELLCAMQDNPKLKIEIQGHICCQPSSDFNGLSTARAKVIYNFLITNKISRNRLSFRGYGTSNPIYPIPEQSEKEEEANRRVEILIVEN